MILHKNPTVTTQMGKIRINLTIKPNTFKLLKEASKNGTAIHRRQVSMSEIVDQIVTENIKTRKQQIIDRKKEIMKEFNYILLLKTKGEWKICSKNAHREILS